MALLLVLLLAVQSYAATLRSAIYAQSNNPIGNQIYVYEVDLPSGNATYVSAVNTQDIGGGTPHSQGSLVTSGNYLLAANGGGNSISLFWINSSDPTQLTFINKLAIQGTFPTTIATTTEWGNVACVVTTNYNLTLSCYQFNMSGLFYLPAWTRNLGIYANGSFPTSQVSFSPQNDFLVIQFKFLTSPSVGALIFPITNNNLATSPVVVPASTPLGPGSYGFIFLGDNTIVTTDAADGIIAYTIMSNGSVSSNNAGMVNPNNSHAYCWMVYSPLTKHAYAIAAGGNVTELSVGTNNALSIVSSPLLPGATTALTDGVIVSKAGTDWLYVLSSTEGITGWKITGAGDFSYMSAFAYPNGLDSSTMAGLAGIVTSTSSQGSVVKGSVVVLVLAILFNLLAY